MSTTAPDSSRTGRTRAPKHEPKHGPRGASSKKKRGFFRRFWWLFIAVPLIGALGVFATLLYVYLHLQLPDRLPPVLVYAD